MEYLRLFENHSDYESAESGLVLPNVSHCIQENEVHYNPIEVNPYASQYLTFVALENSFFNYFKQNNTYEGGLFYSLDSGDTWVEFGQYDSSIEVLAGNKLMWKGNGLSIDNFGGIGKFVTFDYHFNVEGNIMSLVSGDSFINANSIVDDQFSCLFQGCWGLISAENLVLPVTTLANTLSDLYC